MANERVPGTYDLDTQQWMQSMKDTKITWTEEQVYAEYAKIENADIVGTSWCQAMMAGVLGNMSEARNKYPEMFI